MLTLNDETGNVDRFTTGNTPNCLMTGVVSYGYQRNRRCWYRRIAHIADASDAQEDHPDVFGRDQAVFDITSRGQTAP